MDNEPLSVLPIEQTGLLVSGQGVVRNVVVGAGVLGTKQSWTQMISVKATGMACLFSSIRITPWAILSMVNS